VPGHDSKDRAAGTGESGTGELGTRMMEQNRWDRTGGTVKRGQPQRIVRIVQPGKETEDRMVRT
jgi:hypothetical protein